MCEGHVGDLRRRQVAYREPGSGSNPVGTLKILFADDSATMRQVAEITFAGSDYELVLLQGGEDAAANAAELDPSVAILDTNMPGVDGYDACQAIRASAATSHIPVLLLSGQSQPYDEKRGTQVGASDHILKPFETQVILDKVAALAASKPEAAVAPAPPPYIEPEVKAASSKSLGGNKTVIGLGAPRMKPPAPRTPPPAPIGPPAAPRTVDLGPEPVDEEFQLSDSAEFQAGTLAELAQTPEEHAPPPAPRASPSTELDAVQVEALRSVAAEIIEKVAWEVIPDLAETIIREELAKLLQE